MSGLCGRPGCNAPAVATFRFNSGRTSVWLGDLDENMPGWGGRLCREHADRLRPPRGWELFDFRGVTALPSDREPQEAETPLLARAFRGARAS